MPLRILIVGAGPVGLTAAIALATNGHVVEVFEKSAFSKEIGAAMQLAPQVVRLLNGLGVSVEDLNGRPCQRWAYRDAAFDSEPTRIAWEWSERAKEYGIIEPQIMVHRVDAHDALRKKAVSFPNVHLHLSSRVTSVDTQDGRITLEGGQTHTGDLIVGADGVHSVVVSAVASEDEDLTAHYGQMNIYRFMVSAEDLSSKPLVVQYLDKIDWHNCLNGISHNGRNIVIYPCRQLSLLNCATFVRRDVDKGPIPAGTWNTPGTRDELRAALDGFPEHVTALVDLADDIKHWSTVKRHCPRTYIKGRTVLVGDSAHPMPSTYGAGAGTGIEDVCVLATILDKDSQPCDIHSRLRLYNDLRYARGTTIMYASHARQDPEGSKAKLETLVPGAQIPSDMIEYMWTYDGLAETKQALAGYRSLNNGAHEGSMA